jgi:hypothetical protein
MNFIFISYNGIEFLISRYSVVALLQCCLCTYIHFQMQFILFHIKLHVSGLRHKKNRSFKVQRFRFRQLFTLVNKLNLKIYVHFFLI